MRMAGHAKSGTGAVLLSMALAIPMAPARAALIGDEAVAAGSQAEADRAKVRAFLERADLRERLQAMGVSALGVGDRVASLTDAEVHALAGRIDALPAGGALSDRDILIVILIAVLVAILL